MDHASLIVDDIHNLLDRLQQTLTTANGKTIHVRGDFTRLCMMPDLNARQRKMLHSLEMTGRRIPGTQEVRNLMGKYMTGCCVRYGVPFMCTLFNLEIDSARHPKIAALVRNLKINSGNDVNVFKDALLGLEGAHPTVDDGVLLLFWGGKQF